MESDLGITGRIGRINYEILKLESWLERHYECWAVSKKADKDNDSVIITVDCLLGCEIREYNLSFPAEKVYSLEEIGYNNYITGMFRNLLFDIVSDSYNFVERKVYEFSQ